MKMIKNVACSIVCVQFIQNVIAYEEQKYK